jgi:hypothetical protein
MISVAYNPQIPQEKGDQKYDRLPFATAPKVI